MNRVAGTIVLVQEERFQLDCDDGTNRLFVLAHDAPLEAEELVALKGSRVEVEYDEQPQILAHAARRLRREPTHERHP